MLSVILPSYKDPLLHKTMASCLEHAAGDIEVIAVLDGYWTTPQTTDPRVRWVHLGQNRGMREAINAGVRASRGRYLMRLDEHCAVCPRFDVLLTEEIQDNWIVTPVRYALNPDTWTVMEEVPPVIYEKLVITEHPKFHGHPWRSRDRERAGLDIDETMAMQGSGWVMSRAHWDRVIQRLDSEGYGVLYQDSVEMTMKTWQAGGKLMVNKRAWFAHKHRAFKRTHDYPGDEARRSWQYALTVWGDYYRQHVAPKFGL